MRILFGTYDVRSHPRVRVLQEGFAALGDEVLECNVPLGLDTGWRVRMLRRPWLLPLLLLRLAAAWWQLWGRSHTVQGPVDVVVVGYLGHFDVHLARRRAGPRRDRGGGGTARLVPRAAVQRRGEPARRLVASHDVCLGIFGSAPKALRVVPNEVFQGAAAGCAVVTSDTTPQRAALGTAGIFVPAGDAEALAAALADLAADPKRVMAARIAAHRRAVEAFTPGDVVAGLRARLAACTPRGR